MAVATAADMQGIDALFTMSQVRAVVPLSSAQIYRKIAEGRFPAAVKFGSRSFWRKSEIVAWIADPHGWNKGAF